MKSLVLFVALFAVGFAKIYDRCTLARELRDRHHFATKDIPTWMCIIQHESNYNTDATNNDTGDHGLFQISQIYWCSPPGNGCGMTCASLHDDDITNDVQCVRHVFSETEKMGRNGFSAWTTYQYCHGDQSSYVAGCF